MKIVTKHAGACASITTLPDHRYVYTAGTDGTLHVLADRGETVLSKLRHAGGVGELALGRNGTRVAYLEHASRRVGWRDVHLDKGQFPPARGTALPGTVTGLHLTAVGTDRMVAVGCTDGVVVVYEWSTYRRQLITRCVHEIRDRQITCTQFIDPVGMLLAVGHSGATDRNRNRGDLLTVYDGLPDNRVRLESLFDVDVGLRVHCVARTEARVLYAGLAEGRLLRLDLREYVPRGRPPVPDVVRVPDEPVVRSIAASACGRYVAVGAEYDDYGAVLLYDSDLKPLAMFDTPSEPTALAFYHPWMPDRPPTPELFSGHAGGQVYKWYLDRQLTWMKLVEERPVAREASVHRPAEVLDHGRAIDL